MVRREVVERPVSGWAGAGAGAEYKHRDPRAAQKHRAGAEHKHKHHKHRQVRAGEVGKSGLGGAADLGRWRKPPELALVPAVCCPEGIYIEIVRTSLFSNPRSNGARGRIMEALPDVPGSTGGGGAWMEGVGEEGGGGRPRVDWFVEAVKGSHQESSRSVGQVSTTRRLEGNKDTEVGRVCWPMAKGEQMSRQRAE